MNAAPPLLSHTLRGTLVALLAASILSLASPAQAQCASSPDVAQAMSSAESVFVGRVTSTDDLDRIARMRVLSIWKGRDLPQVVEVHGRSGSGAESGADDRTFVSGTTYLVVPENSRAPFLATACSATQPYRDPVNIIPAAYQDAIGAATGRVPAVVVDEAAAEAAFTQSLLPLLGLIALIAALWAVVLWWRSHRRERVAASVKGIEIPEKPEPKVKRLRRRSYRRDTSGSAKATRRTIRRNRRGLRSYRRRQARQLAASRKARGSTDTS